MPASMDGPASPHFKPVPVEGNVAASQLKTLDIPGRVKKATDSCLSGSCVCWGIPFEVGDPTWIDKEPVSISFDNIKAPWLVLMHTTTNATWKLNSSGIMPAFRGMGQMGDHIADYVFLYADNSEERVKIKKRHQIGLFGVPEPCIEAVSHSKSIPLPGGSGEGLGSGNEMWGFLQNQVSANDQQTPKLPWLNTLWAWENPHPKKEIVGLRIEPTSGKILVFGITTGNISSTPIRWESRKKALLTLPANESFDPIHKSDGGLKQIKLDMGQVISAIPQTVYPEENWEQTYNNQLPVFSDTRILVEYTAHPEANFHFLNENTVSVKELHNTNKTGRLEVVPTALQQVTIRTVEKDTGKEIAVKLHIHGQFGEYLAPMDRQRHSNPFWFQDFCADFTHRPFRGFENPSADIHHCTYIPGKTTILLPQGKIYLEVSKGFEIQPVRKIIDVTGSTKEIVIKLEKVLHWREQGWITADTHVHFLAPSSALLEGACEGVNVVNLLASQWGEMMTNVGDFDGTTTYGSKDTGGDGEYLVRVGTENRQHVLGHISLLGYSGDIITPLCSGGAQESALGDPVSVLLTEWAMQCKKQDGIVIIPHFPTPRLENAAAIVSGNADGIEMTSWGNLYGGISPYALSDWYRYLNCGYLVAAVGGTDKMSADTAVGAIRTYAKIDNDTAFTYESWKEAVKTGNTFVTYGPLLEFQVEGKPAGSWLDLGSSGGQVDIDWKVASATIPMSKVDLIVNGEILESKSIDSWQAKGSWSVNLKKCSWLALLVRGHYKDQQEVITAHSSPVMAKVKGTRFMAAADAVTILEQIEGTMAYIETIGTRADEKRLKSMLLILAAAHRELHNRLHQTGHYHEHTVIKKHEGHS